MTQYFKFNDILHAACDPALNTQTSAVLFENFCARSGKIMLSKGEKQKFSTGTATYTDLSDTEEYTVTVTEDGIGILGRDTSSLIRGYLAFLMQIEVSDSDAGNCFRVECQTIHGNFSVGMRMAHLCVFPETKLYNLRRTLRFLGVLGYTHVIIEFWGMLKFDCLAELAWPNAYTKEQIRPVIREARELGIEVIPMFNHLGHATASRVWSGKHVVLDQNPRLAALFTPDGWCWDIRSEKAISLLRSVRHELYELFDHPKYFHLGCDEAYLFTAGYVSMEELAAYFARITHETTVEGCTPLLWGDMFIPADMMKEGNIYAVAKNEAVADIMLSALEKGTIIADWQYDIDKAPVISSIYFKKKGFKVLGCPWFKHKNIQAFCETADSGIIDGVMITVWHKLYAYTPSLLRFARLTGLAAAPWSRHCSKAENMELTETASLLRKCSPESGTYEDFGFSPYQISKNLD